MKPRLEFVHIYSPYTEFELIVDRHETRGEISRMTIRRVHLMGTEFMDVVFKRAILLCSCSVEVAYAQLRTLALLHFQPIHLHVTINLLP